MQDTYNLLGREVECEMLPSCADEGVRTIVYSPLARGRLARPWGESTARSKNGEPYAKLQEVTAESDQRVVDEVCSVAEERGIRRAQVAFAWRRRNSLVAAPIVGALKTKHIDDAIAALSITLPGDEAARLEAPYTPRLDN